MSDSSEYRKTGGEAVLPTAHVSLNSVIPSDPIPAAEDMPRWRPTTLAYSTWSFSESI